MKKIILALNLLLLSIAAYADNVQWQAIAPGFFYTQFQAKVAPQGYVHAFRFNLQNYQLRSALAKDQQNLSNNVADLVKTNQALLGVNGGFFTPNFQPIGLRINQGVVRNPIQNTAWWGVFFTRNNQAYIVGKNDFKTNKSIDFAVQSGPRLLINGKIPNLKPGVANRTALGIDGNGNVIILVTDNAPLATDDLATIMKNDLGCVNAINLDGGSSTQLYAKINKFKLNLPSFANVTDAVLVVPRSS